MADDTEHVRLVKYALLQTTIAPSLICDLLVFIYFFRHWRKEILAAPQNHVILCLLIVSFIQKTTDILFHLYYLRWGTVVQETYSFCVTWTWLNYSLYCVSLDLVTLCCLERHLFVFHSQMMKKKWCLILFHYIPLIICLLYTPLFYLRFIFFPPNCTNVWDYTVVYCGAPCYLDDDPVLGAFDWLFHCGTPTLIIVIANLLLFCRVVCQEIKHKRPLEWNRQKRLIIQLVFISALFLILASPSVIIGCIQILWIPTFLINIQNNYFYYAGCFINQLLPFIIVSSRPKIYQEWKQWIEHWRRRFQDGPSRIYPRGTTTVRSL
jgi:hypothetical protein